MTRLDRVRERLAEEGLDAVIVSHPANRFYLSGFPADDHAPDESAGIVLVDRAAAALYVSPTNLPWAKASAGGGVAVEPWTPPWSRFLGERMAEQGWERVGFEAEALTVADHAGILEGVDAAARLLPLREPLSSLRAVKEPSEVATIERAIRLTDAAFAEALRAVRPGATERQLAWRIDSLLREHGADGNAFATIVAAGPHAARPHHDPSDRPVERNEPIIIDMGARLDGYAADLTRTVWIGEPTSAFRSDYNTVLAAQTAAFGGIRPGILGKEADALARTVVSEAGLGDAFSHGLGHGLGIKVHEAPRLGKTSDDALRPGNVVTVEPGIYRDGSGGIRIEDVVVVEEGGVRVLTTAAKTLDGLIV